MTTKQEKIRYIDYMMTNRARMIRNGDKKGANTLVKALDDRFGIVVTDKPSGVIWQFKKKVK